MTKKPDLKLVNATSDAAAPPSALGKSGAALWRSIMSEYSIEDSGGKETLMQACAAADRLSEYTAAIDHDGPTVRTKAGLREHPLVKIELATRSFVVRTLQRLGLDVEPIKQVGRPVAGGWRDEH